MGRDRGVYAVGGDDGAGSEGCHYFSICREKRMWGRNGEERESEESRTRYDMGRLNIWGKGPESL